MTLGTKYEFEHLLSFANETLDGMCSALLERDKVYARYQRRLWVSTGAKKRLDDKSK